MQFQPKTDEQIERENLCQEGQYPYTVMSAVEKEDKNGDPFFSLKLFVHAPDGRDWHVYDNVSPAWMAHKLRHICYGTGLGDKYESGKLTAHDLERRQGHCELGIEPGKGSYAAKNIIVDYVVPDDQKEASSAAKEKPAPKAPTAAPGAPPSDDDVPF